MRNNLKTGFKRKMTNQAEQVVEKRMKYSKIPGNSNSINSSRNSSYNYSKNELEMIKRPFVNNKNSLKINQSVGNFRDKHDTSIDQFRSSTNDGVNKRNSKSSNSGEKEIRQSQISIITAPLRDVINGNISLLQYKNIRKLMKLKNNQNDSKREIENLNNDIIRTHQFIDKITSGFEFKSRENSISLVNDVEKNNSNCSDILLTDENNKIFEENQSVLEKSNKNFYSLSVDRNSSDRHVFSHEIRTNADSVIMTKLFFSEFKNKTNNLEKELINEDKVKLDQKISQTTIDITNINPNKLEQIESAFQNLKKDEEIVLVNENQEKFYLPKDQESALKLVKKIDMFNFDVVQATSFKIDPEMNSLKKEEKDREILRIKEELERVENLRLVTEEEKFQYKKMLERKNQIEKNLKGELICLNHSMKQLMEELEMGERQRRYLHTQIQELRGSIRVFCRVKPELNEDMSLSTCIKYPELLTSSYKESPELYTIELINDNHNSKNNLNNNSKENSIFNFDKIFPENSSQIQIFKEVQPFIQSALDGENVCIFAYGPTGSGKTYTMQGPTFDTYEITELSGILPRTASFIFEQLNRMEKIGIKSNLFFSAIEVYNENIYDLLNPKEKIPLQIHFIKNANVFIKNLTWYQLNSKEDVCKYTKEASETRRSESTKYNSQSSRSHAIFQIKIESSTRSGSEYTSFINIIDLAGSERSLFDSHEDKSKNELEQMKKNQNESNYINKSLTSLGRIINMLADKKSNKQSIPYRESKLTMILQNSLKPGSKTAMIVNVSSSEKSVSLTKEALNFAKKAIQVC